MRQAIVFNGIDGGCCFLETGGIMIVPYPAPENQVWKPSCPLRPFFGVEPVLLNEEVSKIYVVTYIEKPKEIILVVLDLDTNFS